MGFFDNVSHSFNRGVNTVNRSGKTAQLNLQLKNLMAQRQSLVAQLGASLYEATRNDPQLRTGREALYDGIADIDAQRAAIEAQVEQIQAEQAAQKAALRVYRCPKCGSAVAATDLFCMGCGLPIAQVMAGQQAGASRADTPAVGGKTCSRCGAPIAEGDLFCMSCGARVESEPAAEEATSPSAEPTSVDSPGPHAEPAARRRATPAHAVPVASTVSDKTRLLGVPNPADLPSSAFADARETSDAPAKLTCPSCGAEVAPGERFCFSCGHKLI